MRAIGFTSLALIALALQPRLHAMPVNIVVVVDESGSMAGEHAWLPGMISQLDADLANLGFSASFGLYGFGGGGSGNLGRQLLNNGSAADFAIAAGNLVTSGSLEDGYSGLHFARNNFSFDPGAAVNYILVTDEDRDNGNNALTFSTIETMIGGQNGLLNVVVDNAFSCAAGTALGIDSDGNGYAADGSGGFVTCANGTVGSGDGATSADYVALALNLGGAAWNLNQLRLGGLVAQSFTSAFIDIKVQEIQQQMPGVPEPGSMLLSAAGIAALGVLRWRRNR